MSHEFPQNGISGRFWPTKIGISDNFMPDIYGISDKFWCKKSGISDNFMPKIYGISDKFILIFQK